MDGNPSEDKQVCVTVTEENETGLNEDTSIAGAGLVSYMLEWKFIYIILLINVSYLYSYNNIPKGLAS